MDVLEAIMRIIADLFTINGIPNTTAVPLVGVMQGFFQGLMAFAEMLRKMFEMFQGGLPV